MTDILPDRDALSQQMSTEAGELQGSPTAVTTTVKDPVATTIGTRKEAQPRDDIDPAVVTRYYTYRKDVPLQPGQTLGFTQGEGYYAAGTPTPGDATRYYTYKDQVPLKLGQTLGFAPGKGYYAISAPDRTKPTPPSPPHQVSPPVNSPGSYIGTQPIAAPAQPINPRTLLHATSTQLQAPQPLAIPPQWAHTAGREQYAFNYLRTALNLSSVAAAALVGNMTVESYDYTRPGNLRLVPTLGEIDSTLGGYGIAQWTNVYRKEALGVFADNDALHRPVTDFGLQLDFVVWEITHADQLYYPKDGGTGVYLLDNHNILADLQSYTNPTQLSTVTLLVETDYETAQPGAYTDFARLQHATDILNGKFGVKKP